MTIKFSTRPFDRSVGFWLNRIPNSGYREKALIALNQQKISLSAQLSDPSIASAINYFVWDHTDEGWDFWHSQYQQYSQPDENIF